MTFFLLFSLLFSEHAIENTERKISNTLVPLHAKYPDLIVQQLRCSNNGRIQLDISTPTFPGPTDIRISKDWSKENFEEQEIKPEHYYVSEDGKSSIDIKFKSGGQTQKPIVGFSSPKGRSLDGFTLYKIQNGKKIVQEIPKEIKEDMMKVDDTLPFLFLNSRFLYWLSAKENQQVVYDIEKKKLIKKTSKEYVRKIDQDNKFYYTQYYNPEKDSDNMFLRKYDLETNKLLKEITISKKNLDFQHSEDGKNIAYEGINKLTLFNLEDPKKTEQTMLPQYRLGFERYKLTPNHKYIYSIDENRTTHIELPKMGGIPLALIPENLFPNLRVDRFCITDDGKITLVLNGATTASREFFLYQTSLLDLNSLIKNDLSGDFKNYLKDLGNPKTTSILFNKAFLHKFKDELTHYSESPEKKPPQPLVESEIYKNMKDKAFSTREAATQTLENFVLESPLEDLKKFKLPTKEQYSDPELKRRMGNIEDILEFRLKNETPPAEKIRREVVKNLLEMEKK